MSAFPSQPAIAAFQAAGRSAGGIAADASADAQSTLGVRAGAATMARADAPAFEGASS